MNPVNIPTKQSSGSSPMPRGIPAGRTKITASHQLRLAIVYVRQSDPRQVLDHQESTRMQYALVDLAVALGWPRDRVMIIDDDLGKSARVANARSGFDRMLSEVTLGHVGLVVGVEMSRLARNNQEWYRLFDMCGIVDTLLVDHDGVYNATLANDRLLLGMKGMISELELHTMRNRLGGARLNKALRGELFIAVPLGYVILPDGMADMDPDEQVRAVVRMVFEQFDELGTGHAVFVYLRQHNIRLPVRPHTGPHRGRLEWRDATFATVSSMLRHPMYGGAYVYGRRGQVRRADGAICRHWLPQDEWKVLLPNKLPGYISWEKYLKNRERLRDNRSRPDTPGTPRGGSALLGGLLVCGCGRQLRVQYNGRGEHGGFYVCDRASKLGRTDTCGGIQASVLDELVTQQLLLALEPASLELSLCAAEDVQRERQRLDKHWHGQLERARYEVVRTERQYHTVEPENRLVARTLEAAWEQKLREQQQLEEEYARFKSQQPVLPSESQHAAIQRLAHDIPALWKSPQVTHTERKEIVRCLLERVKVCVQHGSEQVDVALQWCGGFTSQHAVLRQVAHYTQLRDYDRLLGIITQLRARGDTAGQIARQLNVEGFRPPRSPRFTSTAVRRIWRHCDQRNLLDNEWRINTLSRRLSIPETRLRDWIRRRWVHGRRSGPICVVWADGDELERLTKLAAFQQQYGRFHSYPCDLTTPKEQTKT